MSLIKQNTYKHLKANQGFTLMEVLISVLILSIGMLGLASLQVNSLRYNQSAYLRSQATLIAYDIIDRMRANPIGLANGDYNSIATATPPADENCITTSCTPTQLANYDKREWSRYFTNVDSVANFTPLLPSSSGSVAVASNIFTVTVNWVEMDESGTNNSSLSIKVRL